MNLENSIKKLTESSVETVNTALIQEQKSFKPFDKDIGKDSKRLPASPEQIKIMDQRLKDLSILFDGFNKWHLDGALNISMLKKEYIGNHKDIDLSVERKDLQDLELFLEKKGYGLFLSQNEKDDKKEDGNNRKKVMRRVSHIGIKKYEGHPMICALGEKGEIDNSKDLNYVDLHIIDRDDKNLPLLKSGVNCPETWIKSYPIEKDSQKINLSHPAKVLYYKINQGRDYDSTDIDQLLELDVLKESDIDDIENIFKEEFIRKKESIISICNKIIKQIQPEMNSKEIFKKIKELEEFKDEEKIDNLLKLFSDKISKLEEKTSESVFNLATTIFNVEEKNQEKIFNLKKMKQTIRDRESLKKIRNEIY